MSTGKIVGLINALGGSPSGGGGTPNAVQFVEQTLTEKQQMQARKNLALPYKETTKVGVFDKTTAFDYNEEYDIAYNDEVVYWHYGQFKVGQKYTVVWDGVTYPDLVCYKNSNADYVIGAEFGDWSVPFTINGTDYGDPVIELQISTNSDAESHEVSVYTETETIVTIPSVFLPSGGSAGGGGLSVCFMNYGEFIDIRQKCSCNVTYQQFVDAFNSGNIGGIGFVRHGTDWYACDSARRSTEEKSDGTEMNCFVIPSSGCDIYLFEDDDAEVEWFD